MQQTPGAGVPVILDKSKVSSKCKKNKHTEPTQVHFLQQGAVLTAVVLVVSLKLSRAIYEMGTPCLHFRAILRIDYIIEWCSGKESICQCRRCKFDPWVRKIPWRRKWQPTPVFLSGKWIEESGGLQSMGSQRVRHD